MTVSSIILAAGRVRACVQLAESASPLLGRPMISYALETAIQATGQKPVVIVGHGAEAIQHLYSGRCSFRPPGTASGTGTQFSKPKKLCVLDRLYW